MKYSTKKTAGWKGAFESHWKGSFRFTAWGRTSFPLCAVEDCTAQKIDALVVGVAGLASCDPNDARILLSHFEAFALHMSVQFVFMSLFWQKSFTVVKCQMYSPYWPDTFVFTVDAFPWSSNRFEWWNHFCTHPIFCCFGSSCYEYHQISTCFTANSLAFSRCFLSSSIAEFDPMTFQFDMWRLSMAEIDVKIDLLIVFGNTALTHIFLLPHGFCRQNIWLILFSQNRPFQMHSIWTANCSEDISIRMDCEDQYGCIRK